MYRCCFAGYQRSREDLQILQCGFIQRKRIEKYGKPSLWCYCMAKSAQIAVKHGGSDPWIFKLRFQRLVLLFVATGHSLYAYQTVAINLCSIRLETKFPGS